MSLANNYPAARPAFAVNFARSRALDPRITFTRASVGTAYNSLGVLTSYAAGVPRFNFNPVTGESLGLLLEEARTNLLLNSTIDGANLVTQDITTTAAARTLSFYGTGQIVLSGTHSATVVGTGAYPTRTTYTYTPSAGTLTLTVTGTVQYAQDELGSFATSWIPTAGATVTRAVESASITGTNFSSWYSTIASTLVVSGTVGFTPSASQFPSFANISDGTTSNQFGIFATNTDQVYSFVRVGGVEQAALVRDFAGSLPSVVRGASVFVANDFQSAFNGTLTSADASGSMPTVDRLRFGSDGAGGTMLNGSLAYVAYYPTRLTNAQLQAITRR